MAREPIEFGQHPSPFPGGEYRAHCRHVVDGDTFDALIDLGFNQYSYATIRLRGVNSPETRTKDAGEKLRGVAAANRTRLLIEGKPVVLRSSPDPLTFGRYVADVRFQQEGVWRDLAQTLLAEGHALPIPR
jgi:endonuclease YncB( thermonuclease family)